MAVALRVLAVAVAKGRAGYVFLADGTLKDWQMSAKAVRSTSELVGWVQELILRLRPEVVVTEALAGTSKKGSRTRRLIEAATRIASHNHVLDVSVVRPRDYANQYEEAEALAARYTELQALVPPKPKFYQSAPHRLVLFEALALGDAVMNGPPERLASAMG